LIYFTVSRDDTGEELWRSDGSARGTRALSIQPGRGSAAPSGLREIDGRLVFTADDGVHGAELWVSDGKRGGTRMVQDLAPGADSSWPSEMTRIGDRVYFAAADREHGRELWTIDLAALSPRSRSPSPSLR
jgi:ELWxxDGT repeat protein